MLRGRSILSYLSLTTNNDLGCACPKTRAGRAVITKIRESRSMHMLNIGAYASSFMADRSAELRRWCEKPESKLCPRMAPQRLGYPSRDKVRHTRAEVRQKNAHASGRVRNDSGRHLHSRAPLEETRLGWRRNMFWRLLGIVLILIG